MRAICLTDVHVHVYMCGHAATGAVSRSDGAGCPWPALACTAGAHVEVMQLAGAQHGSTLALPLLHYLAPAMPPGNAPCGADSPALLPGRHLLLRLVVPLPGPGEVFWSGRVGQRYGNSAALANASMSAKVGRGRDKRTA